MDITQLHDGDTVYVISRNPHTQSVAQIQEASVVEHPDDPRRLALFLFEDYVPLSDDYAMYETYEEAEAMYHSYFNEPEDDPNYYS